MTDTGGAFDAPDSTTDNSALPPPPTLPPPPGSADEGRNGTSAPKMSRTKRNVLIAVAALVGLLAIGGIASALGGNKSDSSTASPSSLPKASTSTVLPTTTTKAPTTTTTTPPPAVYEGTGDSVVQLSAPLSAGSIVTLTYRGSRNFIVTPLDASGSSTGSLANEIGSYSGSVFYEDATSNLLEVKSSGPWTIEIKSLAFGRPWDGKSPIAGVGDEVIVIPGGTPALSVVAIGYTGARNFVVLSYTSSGSRTLMVNTIGAYEGTKPLAKGTVVLAVESSGDWTIAPSS